MSTDSRIAANLIAVRQRIAEAAGRSGRSPEDVRLVAVTKFADEAECRALIAAGCHELAESRPQKLWSKAEALRDCQITWHLIGHLQTNKVRKTLPLVEWIQSADNVYLLDTLNTEAAAQGLRPKVLIEVNTSGELAKDGFEPGEIPALLPQLANFPHLEIRGLMTMAALEGGSSAARRNFATLRELRDKLRGQCPPGVSLDELSMGMSGDFEIAIEEGATIVRIGSALFE